MSNTKDYRLCTASSADVLVDAIGVTVQPYSADIIELDSDGKIPALDGSAITGVDAATVSGFTVGTSVPEDAVFIDTQVTKTSELTNDSNYLSDIDGFSLDLGLL